MKIPGIVINNIYYIYYLFYNITRTFKASSRVN